MAMIRKYLREVLMAIRSASPVANGPEGPDAIAASFQKHRSQLLLPLLSCCTYSLLSMLMTFSNKFILSAYSFQYNFTILFVQNVICVLLLFIGKLFGFLPGVPDLEFSVARKYSTVVLFFVAMLISGLYSLRYLAVPVVTVGKNLTNIAVCLGDHFLYGQHISEGVISSLFLMVVSALAVGYTDLEFSLQGYIWLCINCTFTACYVLSIRGLMTETKLSEVGMTTYNNVLSIPLTFLLMLAFGELPKVLSEPLLYDPSFMGALFLTGASGFLLSLSIFFCIKQTSPTTYSLVGALNKAPIAIFGILLFHNPVTPGSIFSIVLALSGGVLYSWAKARLRLIASQVNVAKVTPTEIDLEKSQTQPLMTFQKDEAAR
eukprot:CAMPEP_0184658002 /NCGR_PEP_ID=MMETSP0308-20130426/23269_1 /TAXON_ID=38269 /ORGANISM="Gloeochaete witrockiana, Strain SAG 46.84" /LENGTH=374 /DNA_ID=CAMNT_0027096571 /DNA_START=108 /DNA_END=1232 /DNA_ORIENTATION=+